jgi:sugar phosphate isomerase/epimerase
MAEPAHIRDPFIMNKPADITLAASTVCLPELEYDACFAQFAKAGYTQVELLAIPGWRHVNPDTADVAHISRAAANAGLKIVALHAGGLDGLDDQKIHQTDVYLRKVMALAAKLSVPLVNVNGGWTPDRNDKSHQPQTLARIGNSLRHLIDWIDQTSVRVTLENHYHYQLETLHDYQVVMSMIDAPEFHDRIGITIDTGHFTAAQVDMVDFIHHFGPRIMHVHLKDHIGAESFCLGQGKTDNKSVVDALRKIGFQGCLSVEMEVHDRANAVRYVHEAFPVASALL